MKMKEEISTSPPPPSPLPILGSISHLGEDGERPKDGQGEVQTRPILKRSAHDRKIKRRGGKRAFPEIAAARDPRNNLSSGNREGGTVRKYLPPPPPPSLPSLAARHILLEIAPAEREGDG